MAGGTWTAQNKVRPGAYINVKSKKLMNANASTVGVVTMPLVLNFGPEKQIIEITSGTDLAPLGYGLNDRPLKLLAEALKRAHKVLLYRIGGGAKASVSTKITGKPEDQEPKAGGTGDVKVTAKYSGTRGNAIHVTVKPNVNNDNQFDVETYLDATLMDTQTVKNVADLVDNALVSFEGTTVLAETSVTLKGGTDTKAAALDYANYFDQAKLYDFNTMALPVEDEAIKRAGAAFMKRMREEEGKKAQLVVSGLAADNEAVINVKNGVILENGDTITATEATAYVAGACASAGVDESLTYKEYAGSVDVTPRYTDTEIQDALQKGEFLFTEKRGVAVIEQDINSLVTFTAEKNREFSKNRVLRVLDDIANNTKIAFEDNFIGKVQNTVDGRELFKANRIAYFERLQNLGAIENFSGDDIEVLPGEAKDSIVVNVEVQPTDALEKLYMTVEVK
ncbi:MAG: phage tail sheath family protein [Aerococcus sp.]|nr:phage tail sheath family protein [Aerococcus sp.]